MSKETVKTDETEKQETKESTFDTTGLSSFIKRPKISFRKPKISLPHKDPKNFLLIVLLLATFFLMAGGLYNLANNPQPMGWDSSGYRPIYPGMQHQFLIESLTAAMFFFIGAAGIYFLRYATRYAYELRSATSLLVLGAFLMFAGLVGTVLMLQSKT